MNIKSLRMIHLYLGCFFAPILIFFVLSGAWQTFNLHHSRKDGYTAPAVLKSLSDVHKNQRFTTGKGRSGSEPSSAFRYFVLAMSAGLLTTTILGIVMAFKFTKPWLVWLCLAAGFLTPVVLLWMGSH